MDGKVREVHGEDLSKAPRALERTHTMHAETLTPAGVAALQSLPDGRSSAQSDTSAETFRMATASGAAPATSPMTGRRGTWTCSR